MKPASSEEIESLIDSLGLAGTLDMIATICSEKAEHIRSNWQDSPLAEASDAHATRLERLAHDVAVDNKLRAEYK